MVKTKNNMIGWKMWEHGVPDSRLTVIKQVEDYIRNNGQRTARYLCECNCAERNCVIVRSDALKDGKVKSCGCLNHESAIITGHINGCNNYKNNRYDLSGEYGIGWASNIDKEFYFDLEDYDKIKDYCWRVSKNEHGYTRLEAVSRVSDDFVSKKISMAELLGFKAYDHIDRNPLNNRKTNFRNATASQQCINRRKFSNNTSGCVGVSWRKREQKWCAYIQIEGKTKSLGYYSDKIDAIKVRLNAELEYYGEFAPQRDLFEQYNIKGDDI